MAANDPKKVDQSNPAEALKQTSTLIYLAMGAIGVMIMFYAHQNFNSAFSVRLETAVWLKFIAIATLGCGVLLTASYFFEDLFPTYNALKRTMVFLIGPLPWGVVFYLAFLSGLGEEILFRGAIQPFAGLALTAILFGLLHLGPQGTLSAWTAWAMLAGILLGWLFENTGSLWPSILCHILVNATSMARMKIIFARTKVAPGTPLNSQTSRPSIDTKGKG